MYVQKHTYKIAVSPIELQSSRYLRYKNPEQIISHKAEGRNNAERVSQTQFNPIYQSVAVYFLFSFINEWGISGSQTPRRHRLGFGGALVHTSLVDKLLAPVHPIMETVIAGIHREVVPDGVFGVWVGRPDSLGNLGDRPGRKLGQDAGVVDVKDPAEQVHSVDVVLLSRVWVATAIAEAFPPRNSPSKSKQDVTQFTQESQVRLLRDLLPLDIVKVPLQLAESLHFQHAADNSRELRC